MTYPGYDPDDAAELDGPAHHGDPLAEQRAMDRGTAVVDRGRRGLITVTGDDRLSWLHLLLTQHVSELPDGAGTEALVLDLQGRVIHHLTVAHLAGAVHLQTEPDDVAPLLDYLQKMVFWSKVQVDDVTADSAVLTLVGPGVAGVLTAVGAEPPAVSTVTALPGGGFAHRLAGRRGPDTVDVVVPRAERDDWWARLTGAGATAAGSLALAAVRVGARLPRVHRDTDERTIPHEVDWIGSAVHLAKGCYRGQETVARVANLGKPPRQLVLLHFDAGDEQLPRTGDPVLRDGRVVGRVGTVALHHELGPVALALVKRSVPVEAALVAGTDGREAPAAIDPTSVPAEDAELPAGRRSQQGLRG